MLSRFRSVALAAALLALALDASAVPTRSGPTVRARLATTANHALSGLTAIDGVTPVANDIVLAKSQSDLTQNGLYVAASGAWTRLKTPTGETAVKPGLLVSVSKGTVATGTVWFCSNDSITIDTTEIVFLELAQKALFAATTTGKGAGLLGIEDAASRYAGTTVEAGMQEGLVKGDLYKVSAVVGAEAAVSANTIEIAVTIKDMLGTTITSARELVVRTLAVTADKGDLAAAGTPVGTLDKAVNPATGANIAWFTTTSGGLVSFAVTDDAVESVIVEIEAEGCRPLIVKITFA